MIRLKTRDEILRIREAGIIVHDTLQQIRRLVAPGITTAELDRFAKDYVESRGGIPAFLGYLDYPASLCVSVNHEVIHGIPGRLKLTQGDIVSLDIGVNLKGFYSDGAITVGVGRISKERERLIQTAEECLQVGIQQMVPGNRVNDVSAAIHEHARSAGYDVVRQYCGHGVGYSQHEEPQVPNYGTSGSTPRLRSGMVIALEPMVNEGTWEVEVLEDGWTVVTVDHRDAAHAEHTVAMLGDQALVLTSNDTRDI